MHRPADRYLQLESSGQAQLWTQKATRTRKGSGTTSTCCGSCSGDCQPGRITVPTWRLPAPQLDCRRLSLDIAMTIWQMLLCRWSLAAARLSCSQRTISTTFLDSFLEVIDEGWASLPTADPAFVKMAMSQNIRLSGMLNPSLGPQYHVLLISAKAAEKAPHDSKEVCFSMV